MHHQICMCWMFGYVFWMMYFGCLDTLKYVFDVRDLHHLPLPHAAALLYHLNLSFARPYHKADQSLRPDDRRVHFRVFIGKSISICCGSGHVFPQIQQVYSIHIYLELSLFVGFRAQKPFAAVSQMPAALQLPQKKNTPGFVEHVSRGLDRMTLTATAAAATASQQPPHSTATSKQTRTGARYPVQGIPLTLTYGQI